MCFFLTYTSFIKVGSSRRWLPSWMSSCFRATSSSFLIYQRSSFSCVIANSVVYGVLGWFFPICLLSLLLTLLRVITHASCVAPQNFRLRFVHSYSFRSLIFASSSGLCFLHLHIQGYWRSFRLVARAVNGTSSPFQTSSPSKSWRFRLISYSSWCTTLTVSDSTVSHIPSIVRVLLSSFPYSYWQWTPTCWSLTRLACSFRRSDDSWYCLPSASWDPKNPWPSRWIDFVSLVSSSERWWICLLWADEIAAYWYDVITSSWSAISGYFAPWHRLHVPRWWTDEAGPRYLEECVPTCRW